MSDTVCLSLFPLYQVTQPIVWTQAVQCPRHHVMSAFFHQHMTLNYHTFNNEVVYTVVFCEKWLSYRDYACSTSLGLEVLKSKRHFNHIEYSQLRTRTY